MCATSITRITPGAQAGVTLRDLLQMLFFGLLIRPLLALFIGCRVRGRNWLPPSGPFVLIANHASHLDTICLLSLFQLTRLREIQPVAAADYFESNRLIAWFSRTCFNILPIPRHNLSPRNNPVRRMLAQLQVGKSLIIFPEGTRGQGSDIAPFRPGVVHLLELMPGLPIVPAYLVNSGRCLPKGECFPVPFFCEIHLGPPLIFRGDVNGDREEILELLRGAVCQLGDSSR
ncbi:MAG: 1-acyl-sn-glycerol-3-phosphate acyltransferase [Blastocatellia bacterium]|nr:1-acyl-sn-glycerol-3-phosphate acyltransferase [Blastocatellia bacterium]